MYKCLNCSTEFLFKGVQYAHKYCNNRCQKDYEFSQYIAEWKVGTQSGASGKLQTSKHIHRYMLNKQENKCAECGISEYNNKPIVLELDHIDGNASNNQENNLRCLCPNCHSQTHTYKAKNKGNGRKLR